MAKYHSRACASSTHAAHGLLRQHRVAAEGIKRREISASVEYQRRNEQRGKTRVSLHGVVGGMSISAHRITRVIMAAMAAKYRESVSAGEKPQNAGSEYQQRMLGRRRRREGEAANIIAAGR